MEFAAGCGVIGARRPRPASWGTNPPTAGGTNVERSQGQTLHRKLHRSVAQAAAYRFHAAGRQAVSRLRRTAKTIHGRGDASILSANARGKSAHHRMHRFRFPRRQLASRKTLWNRWRHGTGFAKSPATAEQRARWNFDAGCRSQGHRERHDNIASPAGRVVAKQYPWATFAASTR